LGQAAYEDDLKKGKADESEEEGEDAETAKE
jgi:hypothetical protein